MRFVKLQWVRDQWIESFSQPEIFLIAIDFFVLNREYQILSPAEMDWSTSVFRRWISDVSKEFWTDRLIRVSVIHFYHTVRGIFRMKDQCCLWLDWGEEGRFWGPRGEFQGSRLPQSRQRLRKNNRKDGRLRLPRVREETLSCSWLIDWFLLILCFFRDGTRIYGLTIRIPFRGPKKAIKTSPLAKNKIICYHSKERGPLPGGGGGVIWKNLT